MITQTQQVLLALVLASAVGCSRPAAPTEPASAGPESAPTSTGTLALTGTLSCSGRGCHADLDRAGASPSAVAYTRWLFHDPHTSAYEKLRGELARTMGQKLGIVAHEAPRCLACHLTPQASAATGKTLTPDDRELLRSEREFGVGCESCHGQARDWLVPHRSTTWKQLAPGADRLGMNALGDLSVRAEVCAGCHIGAPADPARGLPLRDMNHDMIAAGHPRLLFEFAAYHANEPKHWREKNAGPAQEARDWLVGQFAAGRAALRLLADRASRTEGDDRVWPEFAELDCYACHQGLRGEIQHRRNDYTRLRPAGTTIATRWYSDLLPTLARELNHDITDPGLLTLLARRHPRAHETAAAANCLTASLAAPLKVAGTVELNAARLARLRQILAARGATASEWDQREQLALGLTALVRAETSLGKPDAGRTRAVGELLRLLALPPSPEIHAGPMTLSATQEQTLQQAFRDAGR